MNVAETENGKGKSIVTLSRVAAFLWLIASILLASAPATDRAMADNSPVARSYSADFLAVLRIDFGTKYLTEAREVSAWARNWVRKFPSHVADGSACLGPRTCPIAVAPNGICPSLNNARRADQERYRYFDPQGPPRYL
jgi:hypothetical protein